MTEDEKPKSATQYLFPEPEEKDDKVPAEGKPPTKDGRLIRTVRSRLPKLYPDGVPHHVSTKTVWQAVIVELGYQVSWDTVNRALGRGQ